jgi:hypothetical protein
MEKRITLATFKKFMRENEGNIYVKSRASFDGMTDGLAWEPNTGFSPARPTIYPHSNNFGIAGVWLVFGSRDHFNPHDEPEYTGIEVSNCCGFFTVAIRKN